MLVIEKLKPVWLLLILVILIGNITLYQTTLGGDILPEQSQYVVLGSLLDFTILLPLSIMLYRNKFTVKTYIIFAALGCIAVRFLIPAPLLAPYIAVTWVGVLIEAVLIAFELLLIVMFIRYLPSIIREVRYSQLPVLFSFSQSLNRYVKDHFIIHMICSELLMLYYAIASWRTPLPAGITMYKKSNFIAFQVMMIHAIVVETLGVHYWLHDKAPLLSIILLVINVYSIFFFLGDLQALRLNPIYITDETLYISLGLMKRAEIDFANIETVIEEPALLQQKLPKDTADFVIRDFEKVYPDFILKMKQPQEVTLFMGIKKEFNFIAIKSDQPEQLKQLIAVNRTK